MAIQTLHDTGIDNSITSKMDGGVYSVAVPDGIIAGIGDEFTINYQADSLNITFNAGSEAVIGGSFFKVTALESVTLVANSTIYLCANIDLSKPNSSRGSFVQRTSSNMQSGNLNGSGTSRDLLLYVVTTGANGVVSVVDKRIIRSSATRAKLTIQKNGTNVAEYDPDGDTDTTANITVPTSMSQLTNDSGYSKGINTGSILFDQTRRTDKYTTSSISWTATANAWVFMTGYETNLTDIRLNGTILWNYDARMDGHQPIGPIFVKQGQTISISSYTECTMRAFAA